MSLTPPPPPPKRLSVEAAPASARPRAATSSSWSMWDSMKTATTTSWTGLYKVADTVGAFTNKQTAKLGTESFYPTSLDIESAKAARILRTFTMDAVDLPEESLDDRKKTQRVLKKIPPSAIEHASGLAIFTVMRTGFLISGAGGSGVVIARLADGTWSGPSGILLHTLGFGLSAGADVYDVVLILRTTKAVNSFTHPRISLGGEMTISAGPVGNGVMLETGAELSPVWSYVKSKGLYGGLQVDGNIVIERNDENERSYGREIKASEILEGAVSAPYWCTGLHQTILAAEGKAFDAQLIPQGISPAESVPEARRLPPEELDDEDLAARREMEAAMRSFGIDDPTINQQMRMEDPLLLHGPDLYSLATPPLSEDSSPRIPDSRESSIIYPRSIDEGAGIAAGPPPALPPRRVSGPPSPPHSETATEPILTENVEEPKEPIEHVRESSQSSTGGGRPRVPPRRSPQIPQGYAQTRIDQIENAFPAEPAATVVDTDAESEKTVEEPVAVPVAVDEPAANEPKAEAEREAVDGEAVDGEAVDGEAVDGEAVDGDEDEASTPVIAQTGSRGDRETTPRPENDSDSSTLGRRASAILSDPDFAVPAPGTSNFSTFSKRASVLSKREPAAVVEETGSPTLEDPLDDDDETPRWSADPATSSRMSTSTSVSSNLTSFEDAEENEGSAPEADEADEVKHA